MEMLTPGDFAAITRQARFNPLNTIGELVQALYRECEHKQGFTKRCIGF